MTQEDCFLAVKSVLRGPGGVNSPIEAASRLSEDLKLDSMGMLALAVGLENRFKIKLGEDPESPPQTVADVVELLGQRLGTGEHE